MGDRERADGGVAAPEAAASESAASSGGPLQSLVDRFGPGQAQRIVQRRLLQRRAGQANEPTGVEVQAAADHGVSGAGGPLPYAAQIQRAFGRHDVSGIQAHVDGRANEGAQAMGAEAFASGDRVAFAGAPTLHTVAHEAAHVVQQRGGVQLKGGVGETGDAYERQADVVADHVVRGQSAEPLLDASAGGGAGGGGAAHGPVQRQPAGAATATATKTTTGTTTAGPTAGSTTATPAATSAAPSDPLPVAVGNVDYYRNRQSDFLRRHPTAPPSPPDYYMNYGDKYAHRFTTVLKPKLSAEGKAWVDRTFVLLQTAIENRRVMDPAAFDQLEQQNDKFRKFAYDTHPSAYIDGGLHKLPPMDLIRIASTPDLGDLLTLPGVEQMIITAKKIIPQWGEDAGEAIAEQGGKAAKWGKGKLDEAEQVGSEKLHQAGKAGLDAWHKLKSKL